MSTDMFMNTGISTYIWVLNKNKPAWRAGKVQLIDASHCAEPRRKSIGTKRNDITDLCRSLIVEAYGDFKEAVYGDKSSIYCESKIFDSTEFGYNKIVVECPQKDEDGNVIKKKGKPVADASQRDTENVPLTEDINTYFTREVLPYAPDAWIDTKKTKIGYEIPMTRYFYEYQAPEPVEEIATCTQTTICSTNIHGIDPDFLYYCCVGLKSEWFKYEGSAIPQITVTQLNNNMVPLPHKEEQLIIAGYLNEKCKNIDEILRKTEGTIAEYKKLKQAIVSQAVTKGIQGERSMKDSGVEWLGSIPADRNVYRIANLYDERSESGLEELPILTVSINTGVSDHEIADEDKDRVFVRSEDRTKYKRVYPGISHIT